MNQTLPPATVHVDLDGASAIYTMHGWPYPYDTDPLFESGLSNLLDLLDGYQLKATLFVIAADLDDARKCSLLREAVARGHAIGCHSWTHRRLTALDSQAREREIHASRARISTVLGVPVEGFRAPYFDIDEATLQQIAAAGYRYDSSLFPGRAIAGERGLFRTGARPGPLWPQQPLLELPLPAYAPLPFPFHASYSLVFGTWYFRLGLRRHRQGAAPLVLLFHLTDLADPLPRAMRRGWQRTFFTLSWLGSRLKQRRCRDMLDAAARHYRLVSTAQLLAETAAGK